MRKQTKIIICIFIVSVLSSTIFISGSQVIKADTEREQLEFTLLSQTFSGHGQSIAQVLITQFEKIGVKLNNDPQDSVPFYSGIYDVRDYDIYLQSSSIAVDPTNLLKWYHSEQDVTPGDSTSNHFGFHNDTMDALLDEYFSTPPTDRDRAIELVKEIQVIVAQNLPTMTIYFRDSVQYLRKEWTDLVFGVTGIFTPWNPWNMVNITHSETPGHGDFIICQNRDGDTTNPLLASEWRSMFTKMLLYDTLVKYSSDYTTIEPWLAESWEVSPDSLTYTFHLREGLKWHDGNNLTSEDVAFTFQYVIDQQASKYYSDIGRNIDSVETPNSQTVIIHLKDTSFWFLSRFEDFPILPKHIWEDKSWDWENPEPMGSGPFRFVSHEPGIYGELAKFEDWWWEGHPRIDKFGWVMIPSLEARILSVRSGETQADRYEPFSPGPIREIIAAPELQTSTTMGSGGHYLGINLRRTPLNDTRLRQALNYAIDRDEIVAIAFLGFATAYYSCIPKGFFPEWYNPEIENILPMEPNVTRANEILDAAGYLDVDNDGIRELPGAQVMEAVDYTMYWILGGVVAAIIVIGTSIYLVKRKK